MTGVVDDNWETKNQSRRYPLDEDGDVEPVDLITDLSIGVPSGQSVDDLYLSKITAKNGKIAVSFKRPSDNKIVAYAYGDGDDCVDLQSTEGYTGAVGLGLVASNDNFSKQFSNVTGKLAANVAYKIPSDFIITGVTDGSTVLTGDVQLRGLDGLTIDIAEVEYLSEPRRSIIIKPNEVLTRDLLELCQLPPEEVFAKLYNREGMISVNGLYADEAGNVNIVLSGLGFTDIDGHHTNLDNTRGGMCGVDPILAKDYYVQVDCSNSSSSG